MSHTPNIEGFPVEGTQLTITVLDKDSAFLRDHGGRIIPLPHWQALRPLGLKCLEVAAEMDGAARARLYVFTRNQLATLLNVLIALYNGYITQHESCPEFARSRAVAEMLEGLDMERELIDHGEVGAESQVYGR